MRLKSSVNAASTSKIYIITVTDMLSGDQYVILKPEGKPTTRWEKDYALEPLPEYVLLYEYLELGERFLLILSQSLVSLPCFTSYITNNTRVIILTILAT